MQKSVLNVFLVLTHLYWDFGVLYLPCGGGQSCA